MIKISKKITGVGVLYSGKTEKDEKIELPDCPECKSGKLVKTGGCTICAECGWSLCS